MQKSFRDILSEIESKGPTGPLPRQVMPTQPLTESFFGRREVPPTPFHKQNWATPIDHENSGKVYYSPDHSEQNSMKDPHVTVGDTIDGIKDPVAHGALESAHTRVHEGILASHDSIDHAITHVGNALEHVNDPTHRAHLEQVHSALHAAKSCLNSGTSALGHANQHYMKSIGKL